MSTSGPDRGLRPWWQGWHSALRLARRDVARHRGRSLLIVLLVGLPVLLICAGATAFATDDVNPAESVPRIMCAAQARISTPDLNGSEGQRVKQGPWGDGYATLGRATRQPGVPKGAPWTARRLQHLTGGTVVPTTSAIGMHAQVGDRHLVAQTLFVDGRQSIARGMTSLESGRWPHFADEVLVTSQGAAAGLPTHGHFTVTPDGSAPVTVTVVGVGTAWLTGTQKADLVALPTAADTWHAQSDPMAFLVGGNGPIPWPEVKRLNAYGLIVESRQVYEHPGQAEQDPTTSDFSDGGTDAVAGIIGLIVIGILLETMLLAGPAFAVSAARQRRSLALIASNGAVRSQIRRYVLAQAVLLGALAAAIGGALGILVGILGIRWWASTSYAVNAPGPVDIPFWEVLGVVACAAVASLVAAYIPARGAGRLDLVAVLRGHGLTARPVRRGQPVIGLVLAGAGGVALVTSVIQHGHETAIIAGALVLVGGALLLIPWLLSLAGRLGRSLPLPLRMATRDIGRQRGRSAPAVAAIMTAVTALTAIAIANTSDQAQAAQDYQPRTVMGQGLVAGGGPGWPDDAITVVHREAPDMSIMRVDYVGVAAQDGAPGSTDGEGAVKRTTAVRVQRASCASSMPSHGPGAQVVDGFGPIQKCSALGWNVHTGTSEVGVITVAMARTRLDLTAAQQRTLAHGGMLVAGGRHAVRDGQVTVLTGTRRVDDFRLPTGRIHSPRVQRIPAATATAAQLDAFGWFGSTRALVTPATAAAHHWTTFTEELSLRDPSGMISQDTEKAISQNLSTQAHLDVERGYDGHLMLIYLLLFGVFGTLVLVATLVSTALAQAEGRADLSTLAAVGATRGLRRAIAGSQAFVVGLAGSLLGLVIGFVPGVALTWPLTAQSPGTYNPETGTTIFTGSEAAASPVIDIPWAGLVLMVIGVPLLAAVVAAVAIRRSPEVTRRVA